MTFIRSFFFSLCLQLLRRPLAGVISFCIFFTLAANCQNFQKASKPQNDLPTKSYKTWTTLINIDTLLVEAVDGDTLTVFKPETLLRFKIKGSIKKQPEGVAIIQNMMIVENLLQSNDKQSNIEIQLIPEIVFEKSLKTSPFFKVDKKGNILFEFKTEYVFKPYTWGANILAIRCGNFTLEKTIMQKKR